MNFYKIFLFVSIFIFTKINAQTLPELINDKDVFLVDVRSEEEFESGSAKNAVNIPLKNIEKEISQFQNKKNIVLFCRAGKRAEEAKKILAKHNISAINGKTLENIKSLQKGNLLEKLTFRTDKQTTSIIKKGENIKQIAVALGKNAILKKHTTDEPAFLVVLKGEIRFLINNEEILLKALDTYDIPVDVEHEVIGVEDENIFILTKGEW
ncbi:MAG: rhodanese-like domain-containing protein [Capnocytophaga sp.]|nr:rhodanese-like domain-containing protein [Capnocytophaga sp.]